MTAGSLPAADRVLGVVAHPDDESFGLGAVLAAFGAGGATVGCLCFTRGEASTLGDPAELARTRAGELAVAGRALGLAEVRLLDHPDGVLAGVALGVLVDEVTAAATALGAELLVTFDEDGVTGHPDHRQATRAAVAAGERLGLPVLAWTVARRVAATLNAELQTSFGGRDESETDLVVAVDRTRQLAAVACHTSQATGNAVLWRRLELAGDREHLRWLRRPA